VSKRQLAVILCLVLTLAVWILPPPASWPQQVVHVTVPQAPSNPYQVRQPISESKHKHRSDPHRWLERNGNNKHAVSVGSNILNSVPVYGQVSTKPRAALISLVRNSELPGLMQSMRQLEYQWNRKYQYPWVFFNDEPFSDEFKVGNLLCRYQRQLTATQAATQNLTSAKCFYEIVPRDHWSLPDWIDEGRFMNSLEYLGAIGVGKGWMISYRHMCRWNSGFFYKHPRLKDFDWYWRVEPDVRLRMHVESLR